MLIISMLALPVSPAVRGGASQLAAAAAGVAAGGKNPASRHTFSGRQAEGAHAAAGSSAGLVAVQLWLHLAFGEQPVHFGVAVAF
jgi:hypothetical protein